MVTRPNTHAEINEFRQAALIKGAIECVAKGGFESATVRTIAEAAGTSRGLISHYYDGRIDLLVQSHKYLCDMISDRVSRKVSRPGLSARDRLVQMAEVIFSTAVLNETNAKAFLGFWHAAGTYKEFAQNHEVLYASYRQEATAAFRLANEEGAKVADPELAAFSSIALIDGFWLQISLEKKITRKQVIKACTQFIDLQLAGLTDE